MAWFRDLDEGVQVILLGLVELGIAVVASSATVIDTVTFEILRNLGVFIIGVGVVIAFVTLNQ